VSKQKEWFIGLGVAFGTLFLIIILVTYLSQRQPYNGMRLSSRGEKVAVVELIGPIYTSQRIVRQFKIYGKEKSVKAIVFRIDSPGGGVAASQEIYQAVKKVRAKGKRVIASMGSVAASGGYYVACGADTIMANPATTTGSIGVIAEIPNVTGLLNKIGIKFEVIKSGRFKDTGSPYRNMTAADRRYLQSAIDDFFDQFVNVVVQERKLPRKKVLKLADGRVFTGRQAKENGLVDLLGDFDDAINLAAKMGGIHGKPKIVKLYRRRVTLLDLLFQQAEGILRGLSGTMLRYSLN